MCCNKLMKSTLLSTHKVSTDNKHTGWTAFMLTNSCASACLQIKLKDGETIDYGVRALPTPFPPFTAPKTCMGLSVVLTLLRAHCSMMTEVCAQVCVWSTGNAARPIVQAISAQIPEQKATMEGRNPATTKLAVDPFLRIEGAEDAIALGDCSRMAGRPLPATAQVCPRALPAWAQYICSVTCCHASVRFAHHA